MYIKTAGAYIALCDHYMILFRAVGEYPFFKIPSGMILNTYGEDGEIQIVKENSVEIQGILTHPERYAFACISSIAEGIRQQIDYTTTEKIQFDEEKIEIWLDRLALIDKPNSGLQINSLVMDIIRELNYSRPQALMMIQEMRKVLKNKKCIR